MLPLFFPPSCIINVTVFTYNYTLTEEYEQHPLGNFNKGLMRMLIGVRRTEYRLQQNKKTRFFAFVSELQTKKGLLVILNASEGSALYCLLFPERRTLFPVSCSLFPVCSRYAHKPSTNAACRVRLIDRYTELLFAVPCLLNAERCTLSAVT